MKLSSCLSKVVFEIGGEPVLVMFRVKLICWANKHYCFRSKHYGNYLTIMRQEKIKLKRLERLLMDVADDFER